MWSGGQDINEHGEPILLLLPDDGNKKRRNKNSGSTNPSSSHIGGLPCYHEADSVLSDVKNTASTNPNCGKCARPMFLLLQLHSPLDDFDRTLYVFGCNNHSCHSEKSGDMDGNNMKRFHSCIEKGGAFCCYRSQKQWTSSNATSDAPMLTSSKEPEQEGNALEDNDWGIENDSDGWGADDDDDDWGTGEANSASGDKNISMDDLEAMLTNCEMQTSKELVPSLSANLQSSSQPSAKDPNITKNARTDPSVNIDEPPSFEHHDLEMINEPSNGSGVDDSDDEDGDIDSSNAEASKVDQMLSRYLDMEEDEEILSALKGGGKTVGSSSNHDGKGGGGGERYERLPPEERAFLAFSKRLKRAPGQVARYAYGGTPLWSIPLPPTETSKVNGKHQQRQKQQKSKKKPPKVFSPLPSVPKCECGAERVFEFQILPSLLHILDVDNVAASGTKGEEDDMMDLISKGGMNWGSIAVYSCPESCDKSREEFIIVQEAVSDSPIKKNLVTNNDNSDDDDMDGK